MSTHSTTSTTTTVVGAWHPSSAYASSNVDLEAQVVVGHREPLPPLTVARTHAPRTCSDPIDDFFGVVRGTQDSRHDDRRSSTSLEDSEDAPPPPYVADASGLPSYASVAEPPTLAMYLFKFGFLFPLFWLAGSFVLLCPLRAPEGWEPTKTDSEREELLGCLRRAEIKWAKRCLVAFSTFTTVLALIIIISVFASRA